MNYVCMCVCIYILSLHTQELVPELLKPREERERERERERESYHLKAKLTDCNCPYERNTET